MKLQDSKQALREIEELATQRDELHEQIVRITDWFEARYGYRPSFEDESESEPWQE